MTRTAATRWTEALAIFKRQRRQLYVLARHLRAGDVLLDGAQPAELLVGSPTAVVRVERDGLPSAGIYELTAPVPNPHYDRRYVFWAFAPELRAGRYVFHTGTGLEERDDSFDGAPAVRASALHPYRGISESIGISTPKEQRIFNLLCEHLRPVEAPLDLLWLKLGWEAGSYTELRRYLKWRISTGALSMAEAEQQVREFTESKKRSKS